MTKMDGARRGRQQEESNIGVDKTLLKKKLCPKLFIPIIYDNGLPFTCAGAATFSKMTHGRVTLGKKTLNKMSLNKMTFTEGRLTE